MDQYGAAAAASSRDSVVRVVVPHHFEHVVQRSEAGRFDLGRPLDAGFVGRALAAVAFSSSPSFYFLSTSERRRRAVAVDEDDDWVVIKDRRVDRP